MVLKPEYNDDCMAMLNAIVCAKDKQGREGEKGGGRGSKAGGALDFAAVEDVGSGVPLVGLRGGGMSKAISKRLFHQHCGQGP